MSESTPRQAARIYVADFVTDDLAPERAVLGEVAEVTALDARCEADLRGSADDADVLMMYHTIALGAETLARMPRLRAVVRCGVGYDNVDLAAARARGIPVCNIPDYGTEDVADMALGMILALARGIAPLNSIHRAAAANDWSQQPVAPLHRLRGRVLGLVGIGRIGTAVALRAKALGLDVVFHDPYVPDGRDKALGVRRAETLEGLLAEADIVSLHVPLTPETTRLINAETLALLRPGSYLVNTARGGVVDTAALPEALASGRLAGAGIDVLPIEPPPADDPLLAAWRDPGHPAHHRLLLTPHTAWYTEEGWWEMRTKAAQNCLRALRGEPLRNVVN